MVGRIYHIGLTVSDLDRSICYSHDIIFFLQLHPPNFNTLPFGFIHHFFLLVSPQGTYLIRLKCI